MSREPLAAWAGAAIIRIVAPAFRARHAKIGRRALPASPWLALVALAVLAHGGPAAAGEDSTDDRFASPTLASVSFPSPCVARVEPAVDELRVRVAIWHGASTRGGPITVVYDHQLDAPQTIDMSAAIREVFDADGVRGYAAVPRVELWGPDTPLGAPESTGPGSLATRPPCAGGRAGLPETGAASVNLVLLGVGLGILGLGLCLTLDPALGRRLGLHDRG